MLVAGADGEKSQFPNGLQVDHLSENTVGHGVSVPGRTSGVAIEAGYVGETVTWTTPPASRVVTTEADWTNASITLTAGKWLIIGNFSCSYTTGAAANDSGALFVKITDSFNNVIESQFKEAGCRTPGGLLSVYSAIPFFCIKTVTSTSTFKVRPLKTDTQGTGSASIYNENGAFSEFYAVRIA